VSSKGKEGTQQPCLGLLHIFTDVNLDRVRSIVTEACIVLLNLVLLLLEVSMYCFSRILTFV